MIAQRPSQYESLIMGAGAREAGETSTQTGQEGERE